MSATSPPELDLSDDCKATIRALMDAYAAELVRDALASLPEGSELTGDDLRRAAAPRLTIADALRVGVAFSFGVLTLGLVGLGASLLPSAIHSTIARVCLGIALIGLLGSAFLVPALYLDRSAGESLARAIRPRSGDRN
jgi:hypothetical protein